MNSPEKPMVFLATGDGDSASCECGKGQSSGTPV